MDNILFISTGHHPNQPGARSRYIDKNEHELCREIVKCVLVISGRRNVMHVPSASLSRKIYWINRESANLTNPIAVEVHLNSCPPQYKASGFETLYYPTSGQGKKLAEYMQSALSRYLPFEDRGIKSRDNLGLLNQTNIPAIIVEPLFMNNKEEVQYLKYPRFCNIIANAILEGVGYYFINNS